MLQKLMRSFANISIIFFLSILPSVSQAENIVQNTESISTTDDIADKLDDFTNDSNNLDQPNNQYNNYWELKPCNLGKIIALNKVTAKSKELSLKLNEPQYFGNIQIELHKCLKNPDPYNEDNYMLLTITEHKIDDDLIVIFQGWLISSSLSISTFEHPIYEIFAKNCL
jgi:hypothetical protein